MNNTPPTPSNEPASFFAAPLAGPFANLLLATHEAIVMVDEAQTVVALNPAAEQLLGCTAGAALGQSLERFLPPRWRDAHAGLVQGFAAEHVAQRTMAEGRRVDVQRADGRCTRAAISLSRVEMVVAGRAQVYFAALMRDLSEEQALQEKVSQLERRMRAVFELSPIGMWICENERLVVANRAAARLFGVEQVEQLLGRSLYALLDDGAHEPLRQEITRVLAGDVSGAIVASRLRRVDGQLREIEIALASLPDHGVTTVQMVVNDVTERRREAAELRRSRRALRELSASVVEAREEERQRISRELHDELGQRLTALKIDLGNLATAAQLAPADARVADMSAMLDDTLASVRRIASDLRPLMLDDLGLTAAIEWLARDASRRMGIPVSAQLPADEPRLDPRVSIALYRMVQEALTNVARHAQASSVQIALTAQDGWLQLTVADDGIGVAASALQRAGSFGLLGLRERAHMLGGEVEVGARQERGTRLQVRLPMQPPPPGRA
jgi:two-component system, NarL family, sensor histidine kinase UhpB